MSAAPVLTPQALAGLMRSPAELMAPRTLAAVQPSRISASRALMARAIRDRWTICCRRFAIDQDANGVAEYTIDIGGRRFTFPAFSARPRPEGRTGRIIGRSWDMTGALVEGDMSAADIAATGAELPKLYEGRATPGTLIWCRSNRSGRFFDQARQALAAGHQPDVRELARTCYLMRNTGLDGNGTFGTRTFLALEPDHPLRWSLAAQMLCAYMMRVFALDLVRHLARIDNPGAAEMDPALARFLGVGNGSALGLTLFVNNHPRLVERWLWIREEALAHAKALPADETALATLLGLLDRAITFRRQDRAEYENVVASGIVAEELAVVRDLAARLQARVRQGEPVGERPFVGLCMAVDGRVHPETLETLHSLLIELVPDVADRLVETLVVDEEQVGRPEMSVGRLRQIVHADYAWAFKVDLERDRAERFIWYKSANAEEPRRGRQSEVSANAVNLGLDLPRLVVALDRDLAAAAPATSVARFLLAHPGHRAIVTRIQALAGTGFHSPHADIMSAEFVPAHLTRLLNIGLHGIDKTRDFLDRNLRGVLFHGAPTAADISAGTGDPHWFYPEEPVL